MSDVSEVQEAEIVSIETKAKKGRGKGKRSDDDMLAEKKASGVLDEAAWVRSRLQRLLNTGSSLMAKMSPEARELLVKSNPELDIF